MWVKPTQVEHLMQAGSQILDQDKESSLFCCSVSDDEEKKFYDIDMSVYALELFSVTDQAYVIYVGQA